jgi:F-type H+-transporting ATPase subunit b
MMAVLILAFLLLVLVGPGRAPAAPLDDDETGASHAGADAHGGAHGDGEIDILAAEPELAIYTVLVFVLLLAVLYRFAWGPLSRALENREKSLESAFQEAETARAEAAALLEQHRKQMEQVQDQVRQIMDEANRKAEAVYQDRLDQARADAEATAERATREIASAKEQALSQLYERSAELAIAVAGQVLRREIGGDEHRRLVEVASRELEAVGPNGREGLA